MKKLIIAFLLLISTQAWGIEVVYPPTADDPDERLEFLFKVQEELRLLHNSNSGRADWVIWKRDWFKPRHQAVVNAILLQERLIAAAPPAYIEGSVEVLTHYPVNGNGKHRVSIPITANTDMRKLSFLVVLRNVVGRNGSNKPEDGDLNTQWVAYKTKAKKSSWPIDWGAIFK